MAVGELRRSRICEDSQAVMDVRGAIAAMEMAEVMMSRRCMVVLPGWWLCSGYTGSCGRGALCPHSLFESKEGTSGAVWVICLWLSEACFRLRRKQGTQSQEEGTRLGYTPAQEWLVEWGLEW